MPDPRDEATASGCPLAVEARAVGPRSLAGRYGSGGNWPMVS